jgi:hypothetical protein
VIAAITTPVNPTAAAGTGSVITPAITAANNAKKYHALLARPAGGGVNAIIMPTRMGIRTLNVGLVPFTPAKFSKEMKGGASNKKLPLDTHKL